MVTLESGPDDGVWRAIADAKRRRILDSLARGPMSTGEIVGLFPSIGRTGVLKHIGILADMDLIIVRREGRVRWNYLNPVPIKNTCGRWVARHVEGISSSMARLKELSENSN